MNTILLKQTIASAMVLFSLSGSFSFAADQAPLHLFQAVTYHITISGIVLSHGMPSSGTPVSVTLSTDDKEIKKESMTHADGRYTIAMDVEMRPSSAMDWKMSAAQNEVTQQEGRQILTDETDIAMAKDFSVPSTDDAVVQLVLK